MSISIILIASGLMKGINLQSTAQTVRYYFGLFGYNPDTVEAYATGFVICALEIWMGMLAINTTIYRQTYPIHMLAFVVFSILTYINLVSPLGIHMSCGCFGEIIHFDAMETFVKNIVLLCMLVLLEILSRVDVNCHRDERKKKSLSLKSYTLICGMASLLPITLSAILMDKIKVNVYVILYIIVSVISVFIVKMYVILRLRAMDKIQSPYQIIN